MSIYRATIWFLKGFKEYTQGGYLSAAKEFKPEDLDVDCNGKTYMVTGSNSGIGKQTALEIAKRGGTVHMICRNIVFANAAKREIMDVSKNEKVYVHILDISDAKAVIEFTSSFASKNVLDSLDVLINNAGCMNNFREMVNGGIERNFATNTLGVYLLTEGLIPLLRKSDSANRPRVITVSSGGMLTAKLEIDQDNVKPFDGTMVYAQNKRQQIVMTEKWSEKYPDIQFTAMHPGWVDTPAVQSSMPSFYRRMKDRLRTVQQGADTVVWLAMTNNPCAVHQKNSGNFYQDRRIASKHLPLAWTHSSNKEKNDFIAKLDELKAIFEN